MCQPLCASLWPSPVAGSFPDSLHRLIFLPSTSLAPKCAPARLSNANRIPPWAGFPSIPLSSPFFFFSLFVTFFFSPMRVLPKECNEIKNRKNSAVLPKGVLGSLQISQHPDKPKGTSWLLGLWVGSGSPHPWDWAPLVTQSVPQVQQALRTGT